MNEEHVCEKIVFLHLNFVKRQLEIPRNSVGQCSYRMWNDAEKDQMFMVRSFTKGN